MPHKTRDLDKMLMQIMGSSILRAVEPDLIASCVNITVNGHTYLDPMPLHSVPCKNTQSCQSSSAYANLRHCFLCNDVA